MVNIDNLIQLTYEQKEENRKLRHQIIDDIMGIYDTKSLEIIHRFSSRYSHDERAYHVLNLDEAASLMDIGDIKVLHKLFKNDADKYVVNGQITKIFGDIIKQYDKWEEEEIEEIGVGEAERTSTGD